MRQFPILLILASAILSCGGNDPVNPGTDTIPPVPTPSLRVTLALLTLTPDTEISAGSF